MDDSLSSSPPILQSSLFSPIIASNNNNNNNILLKNDEHHQNEIQHNIEIITRQTDYSVVEAREKLILHNYDYIAVIKDFMGIEKKNISNSTSSFDNRYKKSIQQEIYSQLRTKMNDSVKIFNLNHDIKLQQELDMSMSSII